MSRLTEQILSRIEQLIEKGQRVLATHTPNPPGVIGFPTLNAGAFAEWKSGAESFIANLVGKEHVYSKNFEKVKDGYQNHVEAGVGILRAVREDVAGGYLSKVKTLVAAEVFTDFLEMAEHLLEAAYKDAAASLMGAVLEDGLRRVCERHEIAVKAKDDITSLNGKLADTDVYNRLMQKRVQVWSEIRNKADHAQFSEYTLSNVKEMLEGVRQLLTDYLV
jgi:hypothetical protein